MDPRGDLHVHHAAFHHAPGAPAILAHLGELAAAAVAFGTGGHGAHGKEAHAARPLDLAVAAAGAARAHLAARLRPFAGTAVAEIAPRELDRSLGFVSDVRQRQDDLGLEVHPARRIAPAGEAAAEEIAEDVAEDAEDVVRPHPGEVVAGDAAQAGVPEAVVPGTALGIGQDLVGLAGLLEFVLGVGLGTAVRVMLERGLAVGALDLIR